MFWPGLNVLDDVFSLGHLCNFLRDSVVQFIDYQRQLHRLSKKGKMKLGRSSSQVQELED
jgi:hypothetical protein